MTPAQKESNFTMDEAFFIQSTHLAEWKHKLSAVMFGILVEETSRQNMENDDNPFDVFRGCEMDQFIANYDRA